MEEEEDDAIPSGFSGPPTDAVEETRDQSKKPGEDGYCMYYLQVKVTTQTSLFPTTAAAAAASLTVIVATAIHQPGRPITRGSIGVRLVQGFGEAE
ncbi:hypothetical protein QIS74_10708 [Colletotrichum tabaci]|uniref:Uncharacterized protein n=1 Tax=Colletotrichum tabaci TaxID=1209068 RepID=A0AAV9T1Y5_9PEZI